MTKTIIQINLIRNTIVHQHIPTYANLCYTSVLHQCTSVYADCNVISFECNNKTAVAYTTLLTSYLQLCI